jgi:hypothetical protein
MKVENTPTTASDPPTPPGVFPLIRMRIAPIVALAVSLAMTSAPSRADLISTVDTPFLGITHTHAAGTLASGDAVSYDLVDIDLSAPGIHFAVSPGTTVGGVGEAPLQTVSQFVTGVGAQVGINANYFGFDFATLQGTVNGLAASGGNVFAPGVATTVNIGADNAVSFFDTPGQAQGVSFFNAVSGFGRILAGDQTTAFDAQFSTGPDAYQPRTALGLTASNHLLLLVVDGRGAGGSGGMTYLEEAQTLLGYGAVDAINLDGGGSSTLVFADASARVVNHPSGGSERPVAVSLAVFASPVPEPASLGLLGLGAAIALARLRAGRGG